MRSDWKVEDKEEVSEGMPNEDTLVRIVVVVLRATNVRKPAYSTLAAIAMKRQPAIRIQSNKVYGDRPRGFIHRCR